MSQPAKAQEPSMEEILASIRRIIADDDTAKPAAAAPPPRPAALPPRNPVPPSPPVAAPPPVEPAPPPSVVMDQRGIDAMLAEPAPAADDVLDLTEQMAEPAQDETPSFQTIDGQSDVIFTDPPAQPEPRMVEEPPPRPQPASQPTMHDRSLMSSHTSAAVDSAFHALAQTVLVQNARTLEDLVKEMLRPLLKSWLDDNLPGMVERIVKAEIERVARGRS
jgi:cell pole-organizing protein PopZ